MVAKLHRLLYKYRRVQEILVHPSKLLAQSKNVKNTAGAKNKRAKKTAKNNQEKTASAEKHQCGIDVV